MFKKSVRALLFICLFIGFAAGCSGPLKVNYKARENPVVKIKKPAGVFIAGVKDARGAEALKEPRDIGRIEAAVFDIYGDRLVIRNDPATLVTEALAREFAAAGYDVKTSAPEADFVLNGELKEFRLDIADRDRISVELSASLTDRKTGETLWSGVMAEKAERYAGVVGNSKASIEKYINASLAKVAGGVADQATEKIAAGSAPYAGAYGNRPALVDEAAGRMAVRTEPSRAKVYINGVYYGLSPLTLDLDPGVYELKVRRKGYKEAEEKVSVRKGSVTELEMELAGE